VLRDQSLEEAIAQVGKAAGLNVKVLPGSLSDAAALTGAEDLRVTYLDLRRATVAQALDWLLQPERLKWSAAENEIVVASDRRRAGNSAWVYDVSLIALADGAELQKLGDWQQGVQAAQKEAADFIAVVRKELGAKDADQSVVWFAPGQLLVIGAADLHGKADKLLTNLADGKAKFTGQSATLHKITAKRFADRKPQTEKLAEAAALVHVASIHEQFGWQLLAAAAAGKLDLEALTELQIAWKQPQTAQLLKGEGRAFAMRSWWCVSEALAALGKGQGELASLAELAGRTCEPAAREALAALVKKSDDADAFSAVLYAALAIRDAEFMKKALPSLTKSAAKEEPLSAARTIAGALLADRGQIDSAALAKVIADGVAGDDLTLLLAMSCAREGGEKWDAFRAAARELIGEQPLDSNVVVLINRLSARQLPIVAQR
jgi:hypothetical protein